MNQKTIKKPKESGGIVISDIERLVHEKKFDAVFEMLFKIFDKAEREGGGILLDQNTNLNDEDYYLREYTRLASAITTMFANPELQISSVGFQRLNVYKKAFSSIFALSGFRGADHLLGLVGEKNAEDDTQTEFAIHNERQLMKFLLFYSLYSEPDVDFSMFLQNAPELALRAYITLVASPVVLTKSASAKREKLLKLGPQLENIPLDDYLLARIASLWMLCSYAEGEHKHDIKIHLNVMLRKWMDKQGVKVPPLPELREKKERPVLLVAVEHFNAAHAMFRCYAPVMRQLYHEFYLVLMHEPGHADNITKAMFDKVIEIEFKPNEMRKLVGKVLKLKPDLIFYPSLGMGVWTILLANLRLAPIQLMSLGHPATSHSSCIDYMVTMESAYSREQECFSEKVLLTKDVSFQFLQPLQAMPIKPHLRFNKPSPVRLAVTSKFYKLSASFMAVCQQITQQCEWPVEFHFFPNDKGMIYQEIQHFVHRWIPEAKVYPATDYNVYIQNLNQCDIHLSPFPFGGSNSNVDSMRQGIPIVTLPSAEAHSRTDLWFFTLSEALPNWLIAKDEEDYVKIALRLINNHEERIQISQDLLLENFNKVFLDADYSHHPENKKDFVNLLWWMYENHEDIQADDKKVWVFSEIEELNPPNDNEQS